MTTLPLPVQFLAAWIGTWIARHQERTIDYLKEENRVLREKLGGRIRLTNPERKRLARLGSPDGVGDHGKNTRPTLPPPWRAGGKAGVRSFG